MIARLVEQGLTGQNIVFILKVLFISVFWIQNVLLLPEELDIGLKHNFYDTAERNLLCMTFIAPLWCF